MSHNSKLNDGYFEILTFRAGAISTLNGLVSLSQGKIPDSYIQLKADKCRIIPDGTSALHFADGEIVGQTSFQIIKSSQSLRIVH